MAFPILIKQNVNINSLYGETSIRIGHPKGRLYSVKLQAVSGQVI
jgi:hypothetical protein